MRKFYSLIAVSAIASLALVSCQKEQDNVVNTPEATEIHFNAISSTELGAPSTKTAAVISGDETYVKWLASDRLIIVESVVKDDATSVNSIKTSNAPTFSGTDNQYATFGATVTGSAVSGASDYIYTAVYPSVVVNENETNLVEKSTAGTYRLNMPADQHLIGNNFAANSDLMISSPVHKGTTRVVENEDLEFKYRRIGTCVKLTITGITAGEKIQSVIVNAPVNVAGYINVDPAAGTYETAPYYSQNKTITMTLDDVVATGKDIIWFRVLPGKWAKDETLQVTVETDNATYSRTTAKSSAITLARDLNFLDGGLTKLALQFADGNREAKSNATRYTKVTQPSEIGENATYLITSINSTKTYAASAFSSTLFSAIEITSAVVDESNIDITNQAVTVFSLEETGTEGQYYLKSGSNYYYVTANKGNKLGYDTTPNSNYFKWSVSASGITNVGYDNHSIQFNYNNGNPRFTNYSSSQTAITIYKNGTVKTLEDPELSFSPTHKDVSWDSKDSYVAPTLNHPASVTSFTYVSNNEDVVTVGEATGEITFVGNGTAEITVTSAKTDTYKSGNASYTITVTGAPVAKGQGPENPYSVDEALALIPNENDATDSDVYVTGKVSNIGSYSSGTRTYTLQDLASSSTIKVYKGKDLENTAFTNADGEISVDDVLIIVGKLFNYSGTEEINTPNYIYSWNGKVRWLDEPTVTYETNEAEKKITVKWTKVDYATSYYVECGSLDYTADADDTSKEFTMADWGTYEIKVTSKANDGIDGESAAQSVTISNPAAPILTAGATTSQSWGATEYGEAKAKSFTATINPSGEYTCTESDDDWSISHSRAGNTITVTVYPKSQNSDKTNPKEKTIVLHHTSDSISDVEFTCSQSKNVEQVSVTFDYNSSNQSNFGQAANQTYQGITITTTGTSNPQCAYNGNQFRTYQNGTVTFAVSDNTKKIVKIVITFSTNGYAKLSGTDFNVLNTTGTWEGEPANSVSLSTTGTSRITKIVVTYE